MFIRYVIILLAVFGVACSASAANVKRAKRPVVSQAVTQKVNINTADEAALQAVKGIGPKKAAAIVAYRKAHGRFKSLEDLTKVRGIGEKKLGRIRGELRV